MNRPKKQPAPDPVAAIVRAVAKLDEEQLELLFAALEPERKRLAAEEEEDRRIARERRDEPTIPYEQVRRELGLDR